MEFTKKDFTFFIQLGKLIQDYPDILRFFLEYFTENASPWCADNIQSIVPLKRIKLQSSENVNSGEILESVLQYLKTASSYFRCIWKWSQFVEQFEDSEDVYTKWLYCQCLCIILSMSEHERHNFVRKYLTNNEIFICYSKYFKEQLSGKFCLSECLIQNKNIIITNSENLFSIVENVTDIVDINGIKLPLFEQSQMAVDLVLVSSTVTNLRGLALAVASGKAVCLYGPVGCGKTALVQYLASVTGHCNKNRFYQVQLGEEVDSKLLLGTYKCTDVPGEFIWQPGVLTKAVSGGDWLLFEDIDTATNDVVTLLVSLIERNLLSVPGYRDNIVPAPGFQMFFTQRIISSVSGYFQQNLVSTELLRKHWIQLSIEPLSKNELIQLIEIKFSKLKTFAEKMVNCFLLFSVGYHTGDMHLSIDMNDNFHTKGRLTSTRDFLKWCSRCIINYEKGSLESTLNIIQNGIEIFCCNIADEDIRLEQAKKVTTLLGVVETKADYFCNEYKPKIELVGNYFIAGRATLDINSHLNTPASLDLNKKLNFAMTKPVCCLIERVACCLSLNEPVLLVGETGTGKTSTLQLLAKCTGNTLVVLNMNQQSDATDLLGGYKPVDVKYIIEMLRNEFEGLFRSLFNVQQNLKFLNHISNCFNNRWWSKLVTLMKHSKEAAIKRLKVSNDKIKSALWNNLGNKLERLECQLKHNKTLAFSFIEGALVQALQQGHWVLLDEINLASAETLQCLSSILEENGTLSLYEKGDFEPIKRHTRFRLLAAMNPATDVGKKQLPSGIRNRFTEFFINELTDMADLGKLVACYLRELSIDKIEAIATFYLKVRKLAQYSLTDGTGHKPHFSLRTLCRALSIVSANPCKTLQRSLREGFCLSFLTQLDSVSRDNVEEIITDMLIGKKNKQSILNQGIPEPEPLGNHVFFEGYWVAIGSLKVNVSPKYILTPAVKNNLKDLVRIVSLSNHPVLLQGDTSVGKTSLISYLASASGNKCLRINNHEHTDLQEYIGSYSADALTGQLVFKEGVLVEAMRHGYWIILDELNLAPSDVLEALNRVLDENRELYISETQSVVKADKNFRIFATQNPPGLYGGRKMLSRAFRNRFIELHFGEIPSIELEVILQQKCDMPASYTKKIVAVMKELQTHRKNSAAFAGKQGFITLRDLFRWGERYRLAAEVTNNSFYDWDQHIADEGYLILAGRVRKPEENEIVLRALEKHIKRKIDINNLFTLSSSTSLVTRRILEVITKSTIPGFEHIVWTFNLRRLAVLVGKAIEFQEPVLMVGETGCGKTSICQLIAAIRNQKLFIVNCHQHSESSDFLGGLRPVRCHDENNSKLFQWVDGPLIEAMKTGQFFLADEISLADDSVLERLNSLLEPERTLLLSEKSSSDLESGEVIIADPSFYFLSTMNPGGDYGKKELSPALRNRLTEIWCESCHSREDLISIIEHNVKEGLSLGNQEDGTSGVGKAIVDFIKWFQAQNIGKKMVFSIRDLLLWVKFINVTTSDGSKNKERMTCNLGLTDTYLHGGHLVFLDGLGAGISGNHLEQLIQLKRKEATEFLLNQIKFFSCKPVDDFSLYSIAKIELSDTYFGIDPFYIEKGDEAPIENNFTFQVNTTRNNLIRLLRSLQLPERALLLEGSPGVGKTSLVQALANVAGYKLTRINLSEQTDVSDLFGADLPVDGANGGVFAWRDGPFLKGLKDGHWILLDELNLASQSVLEGLNAVLDHRGELFIPELGKSFKINTSKTKLFACQNPLRQGCARKGLPASFLNRFTQVYIEPLDSEDLLFILQNSFPEITHDIMQRMVQFNNFLNKECGIEWGLRGAPWEMNLRDLTRWCQVMKNYAENGFNNPGRFVSLIYANRMRTTDDKIKILTVYEKIFGDKYPIIKTSLPFYVTPSIVVFGDIVMKRENETSTGIKAKSDFDHKNSTLILRQQLNVLRSLAICVNMNWFVILVGNSGSGKTKLVQTISQLCNKKLDLLSVSSAMDTMEILGGFEQVDYSRHLEEISSQIEEVVFAILRKLSQSSSANDVKILLKNWEDFKNVALNKKPMSKNELTTLEEETKLFKTRIIVFLNFLEVIEHFGYFLECITNIKVKLWELEEVFRKMENLNSGGKFEWVDSVLVKCVREGHWLLVENVNLCSPAIIDRLNGLLEPGGLLTLNEKGVDNNGNIVTIVPHPDFRLFFTMDPQRGEISRAMRNRGLEIHLESIDENVDENLMDIMSILHHSGLTSHSLVVTLLEIHFNVRHLNIGLDNISVDHLIRACFLLIQYNRRTKQTLTDSFKNSCIDVYVKSRSLNYEQQEIVSNVITNILKTAKETLDIPSFYATMNTQNLQFNSAFYLVRQQGMLLMLFIRLVSETRYENNNLCDVLFPEIPISSNFKRKFMLDNVNMKNVLVFSLLKFYEVASVHDVRYRHFLISQLINMPNLSSLVTLSESLSNLITENFDINDVMLGDKRNNLPWDYRRMSSLLHENNVSDAYCNKISLLMNYSLLDHRCLNLDDFESKDFDVSLNQYSKACTSDSVPVRNVMEELLARQFNELSTRFNDYFVALLSNESVLIDTCKYELFLKSFQVYNRFLAAGRMPFFSRTSLQINDYVLNYLRMHFKWMLKRIRKLTNVYVNECSAIKKLQAFIELFKVISIIEESSDFALSSMLSFSRKLKCLLGQPNLTDMLEWHINQDIPEDWILRSDRSTIDLQELRNYFCNIFSLNKQEKMDSNDLLIGCENINERVEEYSKDNENTIYQYCEYPLEIIPIFEALYLKLETNYKNYVFLKFMHNQEISTFQMSIASQITKIGYQLRFMSSKYTSWIEKSLTVDVSKCGLQMNWFFCILKHITSFSTFSYKNYLRYRKTIDVTEDNNDERSEHEALLPFHYPVFLVFASQFMYDTATQNIAPSLYVPSLKNFKIHQTMLCQLKELFWRNSAYISNSNSSYLYSEIQNIICQYNLFIISACNVLNISANRVTDIDTIKTLIKCLVNVITQKKILQHEKLSITLTKFIELLSENLHALQLMVCNLENTDSNQKENIGTWILIGHCWTRIGIVQFLLFSIFDLVDPVIKIQLKNANCVDDMEFIHCRLTIEKISEVFMGYDSRFPYEDLYKTWDEEIRHKIDTISKTVLVRKETSKYFKILANVHQFKNSIGSSESVFKLYSNIMNALEKLNNPNLNVLNAAQMTIKECKTWLQSCDQFTESLCKQYAEYYDLFVPIIYSLQQMNYGIRILTSSLIKAVTLGRFVFVSPSNDRQEILTICSNLSSFPVYLSNPCCNLKLCFSEDLVKLLNWNVEESNSSTITIRLTKSCLREYSNVLSVVENTNQCTNLEIWNNIKKLLDRVVYLWKLQEEKKLKMKQEEENLYVFRTKTYCETLCEKDEIELQINEFFSTTYERDFEVKNTSLDEQKPIETETKHPPIFITENEISSVCRIHSHLAKTFTYADWILPVTESEDITRINFIKSFSDRYSIMIALLENYNTILDESFDIISLPSTLLMSNIVLSSSSSTGIKDFYHNADVEEVSLFYPLLLTIRKHTEDLLKTWEDNPTLKSIVEVVDRIMSFEVTSPVSRFVIGADVLLKKLHEWEEVAHAGVSFSESYEKLTGIIFKWRKMEISYWKNSLENVAYRMKKETSKWWFHLYAVCTEYLNKSEDEFKFKELITALQEYVETAMLGEFDSKLDLLYVFHCYYVNQPSVHRSEELRNALWNLYSYYKQFDGQVQVHITNISAEVRKKLNDFVKITRWNDINYWSVVKTVEKTHQQLMKYMKEYQKILEMRVTTLVSCIQSNNEEIKVVSIDRSLYITNVSFLNDSNEKTKTKSELKLLNKVKKLCENMVPNSIYEPMVTTLSYTVDSVNEDIQFLNKMDINRDLEKNKQRSQAKHLLQQKRKTVADLFKTLTRLGLSYRTGIVISRNQNLSVSFAYSKPVDIGSSYKMLEKRPADELLVNTWQGCESNYLNLIAKQSQLKSCLEKPHQDLGPQILDRVKGFANHLLIIQVEQKNKLIEITQQLHSLRAYESLITELYNESYILHEHDLIELKEKFVYVLLEAIYILRQFLILLECCPDNETTSTLPTPIVKLNENDSLLNVCKNSCLWKETHSKIKHILNTIVEIKTKFFKNVVITSENTKFYNRLMTKNQFSIIFNEYDNLLQIQTDINNIKLLFNSEEQNILFSSIAKLELSIGDVLQKIIYKKIKINKNLTTDTEDYNQNSENLTKKVLICIQKLFKKSINDKEIEKQSENGDDLKEGHFKDLMLKSMNDEIEILDFENIKKRIRRLIKLIINKGASLDTSCRKRMLKPLLPLLNQYILLASYIVTQYVFTFKVSTRLCSVLLSLFTDLTNKGFRIPSELLEDEKEGKSSKDEGGMGLADGEGIKDVSDQIESQDELEGAQKNDKEEEKSDEKECKEEENGIEMSDDFGGKSQGIEKKEGEESQSEDENDDELDKEMGETEEGADILDKQIWGSDSEEENDEESGNENNETNEYNESKQSGKEEIGAKDDRSKECDDETNEKHENNDYENEKEINEMDENEIDDNQIDPYHGNQPPLPETEPLDLPEDLQLDNNEPKEEDANEENPFDIDPMKEPNLPDEVQDTGEENVNEDEEMSEIPEDNDDDNVGSTKDEEFNENGDEENERSDENEEGGTKDEDKTGSDPKPEEIQDDKTEEAKPSEDKPSEVSVEAAKDMNDGSKDKINQNTMENKVQKSQNEDKNDSEGIEQEGVGRAEKSKKDTKEGHSSQQYEGSESYEKGNREQKRKLKPGESDTNRSLAEVKEPSKKRLKTIDAVEESDAENDQHEEEFEENTNQSSLYQHIKEANKVAAETIDAATKEQAEKQPLLADYDDNENIEEDKMDMEESEEENNSKSMNQQKPDKISGSKPDNEINDINENFDNLKEQVQITDFKIDGDYIDTMTVERGLETNFYTQNNDEKTNEEKYLTLEYIESLKNKVEEQLSNWSQTPALNEAASAWDMFSAITSNLSQELSEQLRLVLEPTQASRLKGDFRTGRRINMRKVIPYIASQFRKDKIWLRRTKPSKRDYQILLAIDDSSSMSDNHSKELAFESVALVTKALSLIEAGEVGIISFGEKTRIIHPMGEQFTTQTGAKLIRDFTFDEIETRIADALHTANGIFLTRSNSNYGVKPAQLLIIISDGRGVTSEGASSVKSAIRTSRQAGILVVFVIVESPNSKNSILDIRMPLFSGNKLVGIQSYIENFPFPYYLILRDINKLPIVLAEALQQWFELVANSLD